MSGELGFGLYACIVYRDRLVREKRVVEEFTTGLDPGDARSLQIALAEAVRRHRGSAADVGPYSLDVLDGAGFVLVENYRPSEWLE